MMHMYSSMVGKHYPETHIKLLCALIDQRLTLQMPSYLLREKLANEIRAANEVRQRIGAAQHDALRRVERDLQTYPYVTDRPCKITCLLDNNRRFTLDLRANRISWSDHAGEIEYKSEPVRNGFIRIISSAGDPCIAKHQILSSTNDVLLHHIFTIPDIEKEMLLKGLEGIQSDLNKIGTDIEDLRATLCQAGSHMQLLRPDVLETSQQLDRKIVDFMRLQQTVKGRREYQG